MVTLWHDWLFRQRAPIGGIELFVSIELKKLSLAVLLGNSLLGVVVDGDIGVVAALENLLHMFSGLHLYSRTGLLGTEPFPFVTTGANTILSTLSSFSDLKVKEAELIQYRNPVGFGPSLKRWPKCALQFAHETSVRARSGFATRSSRFAPTTNIKNEYCSSYNI